MKTVAVIQARMGSTRLPGKVMMDLGTVPVLDWVYNAALASRTDMVVIATSVLEQDDPIAEFCEKNGYPYVRGSESDVLDRFMRVAMETHGDVFVRLTGDCPFHDPQIITEVIRLRQMTGADYASNIDPPTWPDGLDVEVFTRKALKEAHAEATRPSDRDCVTRFISRNRHRYKAANLVCPLPGLVKERWVLDTEDDLKFCQAIADECSGSCLPYTQILDILDQNPALREINARHPRNERFYEAIATEPQGPRVCPTSDKILAATKRIIPLGAQTFSKSHLQYPSGAPLFVTHGDGAYVYDVDGNDYVDLVSGLLPNVLGYRDPDVDQAIRDQLNRGISFSTSTTLEYDLAERLHRQIPCADMVRFGKNGTDVTTAAVRLARHFTGRSMVIRIDNSYHGWNDWSVYSDQTRCNGTFSVGHSVCVSKEDVFSRLNNAACVIVEPETDQKFLQQLRNATKDSGTLLIFDEVITGFRFGPGGAQAHWGVTPDLACFGKAMGNGMPISAIVGRGHIMSKMDEICFSGTFFGETLSLAAAIATIDKLNQCNVSEYLAMIGTALKNRAEALAQKHGVENEIEFSGHPSIIRIKYASQKVRAFVMKKMIENGVLMIASHNVNYAIKEPEIVKVCNAYDATFAALKQAIASGEIDTIEDNIAPTVRGAT